MTGGDIRHAVGAGCCSSCSEQLMKKEWIVLLIVKICK